MFNPLITTASRPFAATPLAGGARRLRRVCGLGSAYLLLICLSTAGLGQEAALDQEISKASRELLADPLDEGAMQKLTQLREGQHKQRQAALVALQRGLEASLAGRPDVAAKSFRDASQIGEVVHLVEHLLPLPLSEIARTSGAPRLIVPTAKATGVCFSCGGSGWADCPDCHGCGIALCPECKGTGKINRQAKVVRFPKCKRSGGLPCETCKGKGAVPCRDCGEIPDAAVREGVGGLATDRAVAIRKALTMVRYIRAGGIDLRSAKALAPSPKLAE